MLHIWYVSYIYPLCSKLLSLVSPKILCYFVTVTFHDAIRGPVQCSIRASISQFPKIKSKIHAGSKRGGEGGAVRPEGGFARPSFSEW